MHRQSKYNGLLSQITLGAGESGKSTVLKQMRLIHAAGFSASEKEAYRIVVFENVVSSMQAMLEAMDILRIEMDVQKNLILAVEELVALCIRYGCQQT